MNQQERGKSSDITIEEGKGIGNGWDSGRGVDIFERRRIDVSWDVVPRIYEQHRMQIVLLYTFIKRREIYRSVVITGG